MPRSSRHKSSKHNSRDGRDYSDSEKDSGLKDRRGKEEKESGGRYPKDSGTGGEKRKLDSKDNKESFNSGNGEYVEEYLSSSKRRKERADDGVVGRWDGGEDDRGEGTKKSKERSSESKSRKREESVGAYVEIDDVVVKKSSGKTEGKHRELSKEGKERRAERERDGKRQRDRDKDKEREKERERERKGRDKDGKSQRYADIDDLQAAKHVVEKAEMSTYSLENPGPENQSERRLRRKRDDSGDGEKHQDDFVDIGDGHMYSREDVSNDERLRDEKHRDERHRDKDREDVDKESRYHEGNQKDERVVRDHSNTRSDDKHFRDEKDTTEIRQKKSKSVHLDHDEKQNCDHDHEHEHYRNRDRVHERSCDRDHECDHERGHDCERDGGREWDRDQDRDHDDDCDWVQNGDRDREHDREWDRDRGRDRDCGHCDRGRYQDGNLDYDVANVNDQIAKHKDSWRKKRSPKDNDENNDGKSRGIKPLYPDMANKSLISSRVEPGSDKGRSLPHQPLLGNSVSNSRHRSSPSASSVDEYRHIKAEELKYRDVVTEQRTKTVSSRRVIGVAGASERASKCRSTEIPGSFDDVLVGESSVEISSSSKASPMALVDRSPSSSSLERRYMNRTSARQSLDIEESGRRSTDSKGARDLPPAEDRPTQDLPVDRPPVDGSVLANSSCYNRSGQSNSASVPPMGHRGGVGGPFMGALEADGRINIGSRYKQTDDPNFARGQGNAWRGAPNWSSPMPNGYIPFQHGPLNGSFQAIIPQFHSPLFAVGPSMEVNHSGIPYHISDADQFPSHLRPLGWQNVMDGSGLSHVHGWDGNNVVYREEMHMYGGPEWEHNRYSRNGRGWETSVDMWKGNGDGKVDLPSTSVKEAAVVQALVGDVSAGQGGQKSKNESAHDGVQAEGIETEKVVASSAKEYSKFLHNSANKKTPDSKMSGDDNGASFFCAYLSKLDISTELVSPDLYGQCISLVNIGQSTTFNEDTSMLVNLKDCARTVSKTSNAFSLLFPATSDTIYQRAMDIYKKQRLGSGGFQTISGRRKDDSLASKTEKQVLVSVMSEVKEPAVNSDLEMADAPVQNLDKKKKEAVLTATGEKSDDLSLHVQEGHVRAYSPIMKLEESDQALSHDSTEKLLHSVSIDKVDGIPSKLSSAEEIREDCVFISGNASQASPSLAADGHKMDEIDKIEDPNSVFCAGEGQLLGDAMCGSLLFSDGSSKASEAFMPGSNESELVILSRIHHSPDNTH